MTKHLLFIGALAMMWSTPLHARTIPLTGSWRVHNLEARRYTIAQEEVAMTVREPGGAMATLNIEGPFEAGDLLRFSADVAVRGAKDQKGKAALSPYDLNTAMRGACLALVQKDGENRTIAHNASARILGDGRQRLHLEVPLQPGVTSVQLQLRATDMSGATRFRRMRLEQPTPPPMRPLPEARLLKNEAGSVYWQVNGETLPWAVYFGNNQFEQDDRIIEELKLATAAGVNVISFNLYLPSLVSNEEQLAIMSRFLDPYPDVYFMPRIWLGPGDYYKNAFPGERMVYEGDRPGGYIDASSEHWKDFTDHNLVELIKLIRRSPYADRFIGLKLLYYQTGEWIFWEPHTPAGFGEVTRQGFIRWLQTRYGSPDELSAAWRTPVTSFDQVAVPTVEERNQGAIGAFRDPKTQQRMIDFSLFYNTVNAHVINRFAQTVKEATDHRSLVGTFYGYIFELAWNEPWLQQAGHLGLEILYGSPYVDILGAPYSYHFFGRGYGRPVDVHGPFDGINFFGKAAMLEEDTYTHLADEPAPGVLAPGYDSRTHNMQQTMAVLRRNLGINIAHNQMHLWQNLFSEGRFNDPRIWAMYQPYIHWMKQRTERAPHFRPDVAVLADPAAVTLLKNDAYGITERWLYQNRFFLNRTDANIGWYHQSELDHLPDSVRCLVLLNPYRLTEAQQEVLRRRFMKDGRMIVFCYMPNIYDAEGFNPEGMEITGMLLHLREASILPESVLTGEWIGDHEGRRFGREQYGLQDEMPLAPHIEIHDPNVVALARYTESGEVSMALREMDDWISVYMGSPGLPVGAWRELFRRAGVHLYLDPASETFDEPDYVEANDDFLMVQSAAGGVKTIRLPRRIGRIYRFDAFPPTLIAEDTDHIEIELEPGMPSFFVFR